MCLFDSWLRTSSFFPFFMVYSNALNEDHNYYLLFRSISKLFSLAGGQVEARRPFTSAMTIDL